MEEAATNLRDRLLIRLLFHLGCRISEVLELTSNDIDFTQSTVTFKQTKTKTILSCPDCKTRLNKSSKFCPRCGIEITKAVKQEKEQCTCRRIPLDKASFSMLKEFIDGNGPVNKDGKLYLFGINRHRAWQIVTRCAEKAGLPKLVNPETGKKHNISPNKLRDAFAINAVEVNDTSDGIRMLQSHMGHRSITTTMRYRKLSKEEQRQWYNSLWQGEK